MSDQQKKWDFTSWTNKASITWWYRQEKAKGVNQLQEEVGLNPWSINTDSYWLHDMQSYLTRYNRHLVLPIISHRTAGASIETKKTYIYILPIGSMYAIYGNIYHQYTPNVSIYTIHGSYGLYAPLRCSRNFATPILLGLTFWRNLYVCGLNLNIWSESHHVQSEHPYFIIFPFEVHNNHRISWWNPAFSS